MKFTNLAGVVFAGLLGMTTFTAGASESGGYTIVDDGIPKTLTADTGSAERGRDVMINRKLGNCLACHQVTKLNDQPYHGEIGPPLDGAAERWTPAQLRLIVVNPKKIFDGTMMPAFYSEEGLQRVADKFQNKTILSAQDVEDVVAFLMTLNEE